MYKNKSYIPLITDNRYAYNEPINNNCMQHYSFIIRNKSYELITKNRIINSRMYGFNLFIQIN